MNKNLAFLGAAILTLSSAPTYERSFTLHSRSISPLRGADTVMSGFDFTVAESCDNLSSTSLAYSWDASTKVLTIDPDHFSFTLTKDNTTDGSNSIEEDTIIKLPASSTIHLLKGDYKTTSGFIAISADLSIGDMTFIKCEGDLTIEGDGYLTLTHSVTNAEASTYDYYGIEAAGSIYFNEGMYTIHSNLLMYDHFAVCGTNDSDIIYVNGQFKTDRAVFYGKNIANGVFKGNPVLGDAVKYSYASMYSNGSMGWSDFTPNTSIHKNNINLMETRNLFLKVEVEGENPRYSDHLDYAFSYADVAPSNPKKTIITTRVPSERGLECSKYSSIGTVFIGNEQGGQSDIEFYPGNWGFQDNSKPKKVHDALFKVYNSKFAICSDEDNSLADNTSYPAVGFSDYNYGLIETIGECDISIEGIYTSNCCNYKNGPIFNFSDDTKVSMKECNFQTLKTENAPIFKGNNVYFDNVVMSNCYAAYMNFDGNIKDEKIFDVKKITIGPKYSYITDNYIVEKETNPNYSVAHGINSILEIESSLNASSLIYLSDGCLIGLKGADINNNVFDKMNFKADGVTNDDGTTYKLYDYKKSEYLMYQFKVHKHTIFNEDGKWGQTCSTRNDGHSFTYHLNAPDDEHEDAYFDEGLLNVYPHIDTEIQYYQQWSSDDVDFSYYVDDISSEGLYRARGYLYAMNLNGSSFSGANGKALEFGSDGVLTIRDGQNTETAFYQTFIDKLVIYPSSGQSIEITITDWNNAIAKITYNGVDYNLSTWSTSKVVALSMYKTFRVGVCPEGEHVYSDWEVSLKPTLTSDGSKTRTCTLCRHEDTEVIPSLSSKKNRPNNEGDVFVEEIPNAAKLDNNSMSLRLLLSEEEEALIQNGQDVTFNLTDKSTNIKEEDKTKINDFVDDVNCDIEFHDLELTKTIDTETTAITDTGDVNVKINMPLSEEMQGRKIKVVRLHEGEMEYLDCKIAKGGKSVTFETNKFSTYALVAGAPLPKGNGGVVAIVIISIILLLGIVYGVGAFLFYKDIINWPFLNTIYPFIKKDENKDSKPKKKVASEKEKESTKAKSKATNSSKAEAAKPAEAKATAKPAAKSTAKSDAKPASKPAASKPAEAKKPASANGANKTAAAKKPASSSEAKKPASSTASKPKTTKK